MTVTLPQERGRSAISVARGKLLKKAGRRRQSVSALTEAIVFCKGYFCGGIWSNNLNPSKCKRAHTQNYVFFVAVGEDMKKSLLLVVEPTTPKDGDRHTES